MMESTFLPLCILFLSVNLSSGQKEGRIRLAGGRHISEGRVEIFHDGAWGTVCNDSWGINHAHVVCRQLQFPGATEALGSSTFGNGDGNIWMDDVHCEGTEINLVDCKCPGWGINDCGHSEDAGVRCIANEYNLSHNASLSHQLEKLFDSGRDCDLNISVVVDNNATETICAHRVILSLNPNLKMPKSEFSNFSIVVTDDCRQHANNFVRYFYTRKIRLTHSYAAHCFLEMATDWGLTDIQNETANIFRHFLPEDPNFLSQNVFYEYALLAGDEALQEVYLRYLAWNCEALTHSPAWTNLPFSLVKALLSRSDLVVHNETVILNALERWAAAQANTTVPEILLKLIRFPMIPAEDLYTLNGSQYLASKLQGFQFNAVPLTTMLNDFTKEDTVYTSRIYNGRPWSFTFDLQTVKTYTDLQGLSLASDFQTPVHNSAYFTLNNMRWKTRVYVSYEDCSSEGFICPSLPAVSLKIEARNSDLPNEIGGHIRYSNKLIVMCEGRYVVHVDEFSGVDGENLVFVPSSAEQVYSCHSNQFSYQVVVRPYATD